MTLEDGERQAAFCAALTDEWARAGLTDVVVAPGSRSTPLVLALARDGRLRPHVLLDERSAAFFALGLASSSGRPAPLICTSGTAGANFHPAVIEAHQAAVPMIVCTADRPPELHGVGAPQTTEQVGLYGAAVRWRFDAVPAALPPSAWRSVAARSVAASVSSPVGPGPVHLDLMFRDPLDAPAGPVPDGRPDGRPWHVAERPPAPARAELAQELSGRRGVIVAGRRSGRHGLRHLAAALGWPILADARSQVRGLPQSVGAFDAILRAEPAPMDLDVVLRVGEPPASKVLSHWLAGLDADQVLVDPYGRWMDPERRATRVVHADPTRLCADLADLVVSGPEDVLEWWQAAEAAAQGAIDAVLDTGEGLTEPAVARTISSHAPDDVALFVASSMPVRDLEWYGHPASPHRVHANRGANGIDGLISTALGIATGGSPVVAVLGDLAFLHDVGALAAASAMPVRCTFVVVDNDGGGIFSFLPQAQSLEPDVFERFFGTPHGLDLRAVAEGFGVPCSEIDTRSGLVEAMPKTGGGRGVEVLLVRSDRAANVTEHARIHDAVAQALVELGPPRSA